MAQAGYRQIGEVAVCTSMSPRTLRYYEEMGLLKPASRMQGGFRLYSPEDVERLNYIRDLRDVLGFSLAEIREMIATQDLRSQVKAELGDSDNAGEQRVRLLRLRDIAQRELAIVDQKQARLRELAAGIRTRIERIEASLRESNSVAAAPA